MSESQLRHVEPPGRATRLLAVAAFAGAAASASALGAAATRRSIRSPWYRLLEKPSYQPPSWVFPPVWTTLYALIATSGYRVWRSGSPSRRRALGLWSAQLALNAAWSPVFFGARRPRAALGIAAALVPAVGAYSWAARRADHAAAVMMLPYLGWSGFALALNASIVRRNRRVLARR
ncbi:MAG TPA: TspO/MBR family protein [Anaeromyxobacter sp.]|nr:TspO/MBR family protein [Anaeromyxobacter sp.]